MLEKMKNKIGNCVNLQFCFYDMESMKRKNISNDKYIFQKNHWILSFQVLKVEYANAVSLTMILLLKNQKNEGYLKIFPYQYQDEFLNFVKIHQLQKKMINQYFDLQIYCPQFTLELLKEMQK
jgi:hypothetical protein